MLRDTIVGFAYQRLLRNRIYKLIISKDLAKDKKINYVEEYK